MKKERFFRKIKQALERTEAPAADLVPIVNRMLWNGPLDEINWILFDDVLEAADQALYSGARRLSVDRWLFLLSSVAKADPTGDSIMRLAA